MNSVHLSDDLGSLETDDLGAHTYLRNLLKNPIRESFFEIWAWDLIVSGQTAPRSSAVLEV